MLSPQTLKGYRNFFILGFKLKCSPFEPILKGKEIQFQFTKSRRSIFLWVLQVLFIYFTCFHQLKNCLTCLVLLRKGEESPWNSSSTKVLDLLWLLNYSFPCFFQFSFLDGTKWFFKGITHILQYQLETEEEELEIPITPKLEPEVEKSKVAAGKQTAGKSMGQKLEVKIRSKIVDELTTDVLDQFVSRSPVTAIVTALTFTFVFVRNPGNSRFLYSYFPAQWKNHWTFGIFFLLEIYSFCASLFANLCFVNISCCYTISTLFWINLLSAKERLMSLKWETLNRSRNRNQNRGQNRGRIRSQADGAVINVDELKLKRMIRSLQELRLLNGIFNSFYLEKMMTAMRMEIGIGHCIMIYACLRLHSTLPLPFLLICGYWAILMLVLEAVLFLRMAKIYTGSKCLIRSLRKYLNYGERRRLLSMLKPFGAVEGNGRILQTQHVLLFILKICKAVKSFLLIL